ncbi:MAG: homoserine kinase [Acidobacteriota bacterium]
MSPPSAGVLSQVRAFAPGSVSNVGCGFDALGFAIAGVGDEVIARRVDGSAQVSIRAIHGEGGRLPLEAGKNTAGKAALAVQSRATEAPAVELEIFKKMPLSSGLGSSAASAVAAVVAVDRLLGTELPSAELLECALEGEQIASGARHADNVAPSLLGDLLLVRSLDPEPDIVLLPCLEDLHCVVLRPDVPINTAESRRLLGDTVQLPQAIQQWANLGGFVAALYKGDAELLSRCLIDVVAEPVRGPQVPDFARIQAAALEARALGCSLSGSGPAIFALALGKESAKSVAGAMNAALSAEIERDLLVSSLPCRGAHVIEES